MAETKICAVCNQPYPAEHTVCPHCTAATHVVDLPKEPLIPPTAEDVVIPGPASASADPTSSTVLSEERKTSGTDSSVDLGEVVPPTGAAGPSSQASSIAVWASLVDDVPELGPTSQSGTVWASLIEDDAPAVEAPSPADEAPTPPPSRAAALEEDDEDALSTQDMVDLGGPPPAVEEPLIEEPAADAAAGEMPEAPAPEEWEEPSPSHLRLVRGPGRSDSAVDLGSMPDVIAEDEDDPRAGVLPRPSAMQFQAEAEAEAEMVEEDDSAVMATPVADLTGEGGSTVDLAGSEADERISALEAHLVEEGEVEVVEVSDEEGSAVLPGGRLGEPARPSESSNVDLGGSAAVPTGGSGSFVVDTNLTDVLGEPFKPRSSSDPASFTSGVDLGAWNEGSGDFKTDQELSAAAAAAQGAPSGQAPAQKPPATKVVDEDFAPIESESMINLLGAPSDAGKRPARRDLIAEGLESGVNLGRPTKEPTSSPSGSASGLGESDSVLEDEVELSAARRRESSEVDLGRPFGKDDPALPLESAAGHVEVRSDLDLALEADSGPSDSDPDMDIPAAGTLQKTSLPPQMPAEAEAEDVTEVSEEDDRETMAAQGLLDDEDLETMSREAAEAREAVEAAETEEAALEEPETVEEPEAEAEVTKTAPTKPAKKPLVTVGTLAGAGVGALVGGVLVGGLMLLFGGGGEQPPKKNGTAPITPITKPGVESKWAAYLLQRKEKNLRADPKDPDYEAVAQDLDTAKENSAEAWFWRAHMHEEAGEIAKAITLYREGLGKFPNPDDKVLFESALRRHGIRPEDEKKGAGRLPLPVNDLEHLERLVLVLAALQAEPAEADKGTGEAGEEFWKAYFHAQQHEYKEALDALTKAVERHDKRRFSRRGQAQNPRSDGPEDIFLKSCKELEVYWRIRQKIQENKYDLKDVEKVVGDLLAGKGTGPEYVKVKEQLDAVQKELMAAGIKETADPAKGVKELNADRQKAVKAVADVALAVKGEPVQQPDEAVKAVQTLYAGKRTADKTVADVGLAVKGDEVKEPGELTQAVQGLFKGKQNADSTLTKIGDALKVKEPAEMVKAAEGLAATGTAFDKVAQSLEKAGEVPAKAPRDDVVKAVDRVITTVKTSEPLKQLAVKEKEIEGLKGDLAQRRTPQELVDIWLLSMQGRAGRNTRDVAKAREDAERLLADPKVTGEVKARTLYLRGLAERRAGDYIKARASLEQALKEGDTARMAPWRTTAKTALDELTDPGKYYLAEAERLQFAPNGNHARALGTLDEALKAFPEGKAHGQVLAQRSLLLLAEAKEKAGRNKPLDANDPAVVKAAADAQKARDAGAVAEGHYAAGRMAQCLGNLAEASKHYRQACDAHPEDDKAGNRYRQALIEVTVLLRDKPTPLGERTGKRSPRPGPADAAAQPEAPLAAVVLLLTAQADGPAPAADQEALNREAQKIIDSPNADPMDKVRAYVVQGKWTDALNFYAKELRKVIRRDQADLLLELLEKHPAFHRPYSRAVQNPLAAEAHYAVGLRLYWERKYADAEKEFYISIEDFDQDARFFYFLGLTRLAQGKRDEAFTNFEQGARLEQQNRPGPVAVNEALERVQGRIRQVLNERRQGILDPTRRPQP